MKSYDQIRLETNAIHFAFLMSDADTAPTFLEVAHSSRNAVTRTRNRQNAAKAYAAVQRFRSRVVMTEKQNAELEEKLGKVRDQLNLSEGDTHPSEDTSFFE